MLLKDGATSLKAHSKLEVIDPAAPDFIRVGSIHSVLKNYYLMVAIEEGTSAAEASKSENKLICLHATSPHLLPAGWAAENGLQKFFRAPTEDFR